MESTIVFIGGQIVKKTLQYDQHAETELSIYNLLELYKNSPLDKGILTPFEIDIVGNPPNYFSLYFHELSGDLYDYRSNSYLATPISTRNEDYTPALTSIISLDDYEALITNTAEGLDLLHNLHITHNDLHSGNILYLRRIIDMFFIHDFHRATFLKYERFPQSKLLADRRAFANTVLSPLVQGKDVNFLQLYLPYLLSFYSEDLYKPIEEYINGEGTSSSFAENILQILTKIN